MENEEKNKILADLIYPDITETISDLEKRYPVRNLNINQIAHVSTSVIVFTEQAGCFNHGMYIDRGSQRRHTTCWH